MLGNEMSRQDWFEKLIDDAVEEAFQDLSKELGEMVEKFPEEVIDDERKDTEIPAE